MGLKNVVINSYKSYFKVNWFGPGKTTTSLHAEAAQMSGRLEIQKLNKKSAGVYTCVATGYEQFSGSKV